MNITIKKSIALIVITFILVFVGGPAKALTTNEVQKLVASDAETEKSEHFGQSVAIDGDTMIICADLEDESLPDSLRDYLGAAYVFTRNGGTWTEVQKLTASDRQYEHRFGGAVAIGGDTAVISAPGDNGGGAAYVFTRGSGIWTEAQKLTASDRMPADTFSSSVAIDDDTIFIGAVGDDGNSSDSGSVYVFTRNGGTWTEVQKLTASDSKENGWFGSSVAVDGGTAIIGANDWMYHGPGAAYVFTRGNDGTWTEVQKLTASDGMVKDGFGGAAAIGGNTVVIGAESSGGWKGSAYVFTFSGGSWSEQAKLLASDGDTSHGFGQSITLDGDTMVIGVWQDDENAVNSGAAYMFTRNGGTWSEQAKLLASDGDANDLFGISVAVDDDTAVIGARSDDCNTIFFEFGSAYVFNLGDLDNDGIEDDVDLCLATDIGDSVDINGCSDAQVDLDGDGYCDPGAPSNGPSACTGSDNCPTVPNPYQTDANGDGFGDACVDPSSEIHDEADIAPDVIIGAGTIVKEGVTIASGAIIGDNVTFNKFNSIGENTIIGDGTLIQKDTVIGNDVVIGEYVTIKNGVTIGDGVTIGSYTMINQGTFIGDNATIGMNVMLGKYVIVLTTADVPDDTVVPQYTTVTP